MSDDGIFVDILPSLDLVALNAVVNNMKRIFGGVGKDISAAFDGSRGSITELERTMVESANRASAAQVRASKAAADAQIADAKRVTAVTDAEASHREAAQFKAQTAIQNSMVMASKQKEAHEASAQASQEAGDASKAYADAAAGGAAVATKAFDTIGKASALSLAAIAAGTVGIAGNWEQMMTRIQVAGQVPVGQMKALSDGLLQLSSSMGVNQKEISNASLMLSKAGDEYKSASVQIGVMRNAIELAKTEGANLTTVVQQLTTSFNDFQIPVGQAANVVAQFQTAASNAKRPLEEFMGSMHNVEPTAARLLDKNTGLPQMLTLMGDMSKQGVGMDQGTQNLNNFLEHLNKFNSPQRSIIGALGLDSNKLAADLKKPDGAINVLAELRQALAAVTTGTGDDAKVHLPFAYQNQQTQKVMQEDYARLSPTDKQLADRIKQTHEAGKEISPADYRQVRAAKNSGGFFADYYKDYLKTTGPSDLAKQGIDPTGLTQGQVFNYLTGTDSGARSFQSAVGDPTDPNDQHWKDTQQDYSRIKGSKTGPDGNIPGWSDVMKTWKQQVDIFKGTVEQLAQAVGQKLLPELKHWLDNITTFVNFLNGHQGALDATLKVMETMAEIWAANKVIGGLTGFIGKLTTIGGSGAGSAAGAAGKLSTLASSISILTTAAIAGKSLADALANTNKDHYQNADGTAKGSGDQFLIDHGLGWLVAGSGYKTTAQAKTDAALNAIPASSDGHNGPHGGYSDQRRGAPNAGPDAATGPPGPPGTQADPVYTQPASPTSASDSSDASSTTPNIPPGLASLLSSAGGGGGGTDNGTDAPQFNAFSGVTKAKGLIPQLVQFGTTMLAEMALGNPHGKLFGFGSGDGESGADDPSLSAGLPGLPSPDEITKMGPAELKQVQGDIALRKAIINYRKDLRKAAEALTKHGAGSEAYANAEDTLLQDKGSIYDSVLGQQNAYSSAKQKLSDDDANGVAQSNPTKYAQDKTAAATQPGYASYGTNTPGTSANLNASQQSIAAAIIQEGQKRGLSRDQIVAGLDVARLESNYGANPMSHVHQNQSGTDVEGIFQQDPGYSGNHDDPHNSAGQFFDRMIQRAKPGQSAGQQAVNVQVGTYGGGYVDSQGQGGVYDSIVGQPQAPTPGAGKPSILDQLHAAFGGGGPGQSPVFKRGGGDQRYGPPVPGYGLNWVPGKGWQGHQNPGGGLGIPLGPGGPSDPFGPGGALSAIPSGPSQYGPPGVPGQMGAPGSIGPFAAPASVAAAAPKLSSAPGAPSAGGGTGATATPSAQFQAPSGGQGAGWGISGGIIDSLGGAAATAADAFAPGSGAAVQLAMKEGERFAGYLGQVGGILAEGALDSVHVSDPDGNKVGSGKGWLSKVAGGIGGQHQTTGSTAGTAKGVGPSAPAVKPNDDPNRKEHKGTGDKPGPDINVTNHFNGTNDNADKVTKSVNQAAMSIPLAPS